MRPFQVVLQQAVLLQLFVQQQNAEVELVHPLVQRIEVHVQFLRIDLGSGTHQLFAPFRLTTVPHGLLHLQRHLILVAGHEVDVDARQLERQFGHIALIGRLGRKTDLRQIGFGGIGHVVLRSLLNQAILTNEGIIVARLTTAFFQRELRTERRQAHDKQ